MTLLRSQNYYVFMLTCFLAALPSVSSAGAPKVISTKVQTKSAPTPFGSYSQAVKTTGKEHLFIAGQIPFETLTGTMITDVRGATTLVMMYLQAILKEAGMDFSNVVSTTTYLTDLNNSPVVDEVYGSYFQDRNKLPARATVQVAGLPKNAILEISMIAAK